MEIVESVHISDDGLTIDGRSFPSTIIGSPRAGMRNDGLCEVQIVFLTKRVSIDPMGRRVEP